MKRFEKIAKRYALANSYFKNRLLIWPDTLCEIHDYLQQHGELPFRYDGDNWSYDALCERQKRRGVRLSQYLTPDATARRIAALAVRYFENDSRIMDVCCGTGQLTRALIAEGRASLADRGIGSRPGAGGLLRTPVSCDANADRAISGHRFPLRERRCQPSFRNDGGRRFSFVACEGTTAGRPECVATSARFHRQTAPQGHTGNVAAIQGSVPYTYAGAVRADKCHSRNSRSGATIASIAKHSGRPLAPGSAFQVGIGSGCGIAVSAIFRIFTEYWHCSMM